MPESQEGGVDRFELNPKEIERAEAIEDMTGDILSIIDVFRIENPSGGELSIQLEPDSHSVGEIPEVQLLAALNAKMIDNSASCRITSLSKEGDSVFLSLEVANEGEKEQTVETVRITFSNTCFFCKIKTSIEKDVPANSHGKVRKDKNGSPYQDWDRPDICPGCGRGITLTNRQRL